MLMELPAPSVPRRKSKKAFPKNLDHNITEYTQETTIHGLKYLGERNRSMPERIFWITIFIVSMSFLGYFMYKICKAWMEYPIMITERNNPTQLFEIPFPAVTVCPAIKTKLDRFNLDEISNELSRMPNTSTFWSTDYGKKFIMASQVCRRTFQKYSNPFIDQADKTLHDSFAKAQLGPDSIRTLYDFSPKRDEVVKRCRLSNWNWDDMSKHKTSDENCKSLFSTIITNEGVCFTFNTVRDVLRTDALHTDFNYYDMTQERDGWHPDQGYTKDKAFPYKGMVKGSFSGANGLRFVLLANGTDTSPHCEPTSLGFKLILHSPAIYPHMYEKYLSLDYAKEYKIAIIPKSIYTADDLRSFDPETRQCYFNDERRLKYFTFYTAENCRLECYANFSLDTCGGAPFSSPRDSNTTNCVLPRRNHGWDLPEFYDLLGEYNKHFPLPNDVMGAKTISHCNCLPECNSIRYEYEILKSYDDVGDVEQFTDDFQSSFDIARTTVDMFFIDPNYIGEKRIRVYTFETLISDFGGLLGLFMGGSLLSFFELIYFLTIRNCFKEKNKM